MPAKSSKNRLSSTLLRQIRSETIHIIKNLKYISLKILRAIKRIDSNILSKSGLMLGLGETMDEVMVTIKELKDAKCDILYIDQYIQTGPNTIPVKKFIMPQDFNKLKEYAINLGFMYVESAPFARSCYYNGIPNFLKFKQGVEDNE